MTRYAWTYLWQLRIEENGRSTTQLFDTKTEAENAKAAWSLRRYERTGNFDHRENATIKRVEA